jgi:hypothetical protein
MVLQRVPNGLRRSLQFSRQSTGNFGWTTAVAGEPTCAFHDLLPFPFRKLTELAAAVHLVRVIEHERVDTRLQEANPFSLPKFEPAAHQTSVAPPVYGFGRDVVTLADLVHRQHRLVDV